MKLIGSFLLLFVAALMAAGWLGQESRTQVTGPVPQAALQSPAPRSELQPAPRSPAPGPGLQPVPQPPTPALLPGVATWLGEHQEFGLPTSVQDVPDWAKGQRQRVRSDSGHSLLFYLKDGAVMTVYEGNNRDNKVWGQYDRPEPEPENATVSAEHDEDAATPEDKTKAERARLIAKRRAKRARGVGR